MAGGVASTTAAPLSVRRRPAAVGLVPTWTGCSRGAEACPLGHVKRAARCLSACWRLAKTPRSWPCLPAAAGTRAGTPARRRSARVFDLAGRDEPAWLVARREAAQHALATLYSLDKVSGKAYTASEDRLGRDGALNTPMTTSSPLGAPAAGLRGALLDGRLHRERERERASE